MITRREVAFIRLEVEFEVLLGEMQIVERDLREMPLSQFIEVYGPEKRAARLLIRVADIEDVKRKPSDRELLRQAKQNEKTQRIETPNGKVQRGGVRYIAAGDGYVDEQSDNKGKGEREVLSKMRNNNEQIEEED